MIRYSWVNNYMYFIVSDDETDAGAWLYCSGISLPRFLPVTRGRHGLASNPAMRGLQLTDLNLRSQLHDCGALTESVKGNPCDGCVPKNGDWYRQLLRFRRVNEQTVKELVMQCPAYLVGSIFQACMIRDIPLPDTKSSAADVERFLDEVCEEYRRQSGWPVSASAKGFRK